MSDETIGLLVIILSVWITAVGGYLTGKYVEDVRHKNGCAEDVMTSYVDGCKQCKGAK